MILVLIVNELVNLRKMVRYLKGRWDYNHKGKE